MWKKRLHKGFIYLLVLVITVITFGPFLFTLSTSFKPPADAFEWPPRLIPRRVTLENYQAVFRITPYFSRWVINSIIIAGCVVVGRLFACSLAGYAFARLDFPGKELLFVIMLGSMMIPGQVLMVPHYLINLYGNKSVIDRARTWVGEDEEAHMLRLHLVTSNVLVNAGDFSFFACAGQSRFGSAIPKLCDLYPG